MQINQNGGQGGRNDFLGVPGDLPSFQPWPLQEGDRPPARRRGLPWRLWRGPLLRDKSGVSADGQEQHRLLGVVAPTVRGGHFNAASAPTASSAEEADERSLRVREIPSVERRVPLQTRCYCNDQECPSQGHENAGRACPACAGVFI